MGYIQKKSIKIINKEGKMNKKQIAITLGIMCFILTVAICIQLRTIENTTTTISQSLKENGLRDEVLRWKER